MHHGKEDKESEPNSRHRNHEDAVERVPHGLFSQNDDNGDGNDVDIDEYRNEEMDKDDYRIPDDFFNRNDDNGDNDDDAYDDEYRNEQMDEEDEPMDEEDEKMNDEDNMDEEPDEEEDEQDIDTTTSELDIPKDKKSALLNEDKSLTNPKAGNKPFAHSNTSVSYLHYCFFKQEFANFFDLSSNKPWRCKMYIRDFRVLARKCLNYRLLQ